MQKWFKSPIRLLILYLAVLAVIGSVSWVDGKYLLLITQQLRNFGLIYLGMFATHFILKKLLKKPVPSRWEHAAISALILFLLFDSYSPWWTFPALGVLTEFIQRFIRRPTGPLFNPAAASALILCVLGVLPSWWGTNFSPRIPITNDGLSIAILSTFTIGAFVAWKYKKIPLVLSALIVSAIGYSLLFQVLPLFLLLEGTLAFFVIVMCIEPKTSPVIKNEQILFGIGIGILTNILLKIHFLDAYLGSLLIMNAAFNGYRYWKVRKPAMPRNSETVTK